MKSTVASLGKKINEIDKPLPRLRKKNKAQITIIRNKRGDIATDTPKI